jgi:hypothetical protein
MPQVGVVGVGWQRDCSESAQPDPPPRCDPPPVTERFWEWLSTPLDTWVSTRSLMVIPLRAPGGSETSWRTPGTSGTRPDRGHPRAPIPRVTPGPNLESLGTRWSGAHRPRAGATGAPRSGSRSACGGSIVTGKGGAPAQPRDEYGLVATRTHRPLGPPRALRAAVPAGASDRDTPSAHEGSIVTTV